MGMYEVDWKWTSTGTSGGLTALEVRSPLSQWVLYCEASTCATTQSFAMQSAITSSGPWATDGSTALAATASVTAAANLRGSGPVAWVRPFLNSVSTGTFNFRFIGIS